MATPDAALVSSGDASNLGWSLDTADATERVKPRRPYTPYNLFYLLERELVVQGNEPSAATEKARERAIMSTMLERPEDDIPLPTRYKNVVLLPMWYEPNMKEKRKHRKTHGKVRTACLGSAYLLEHIIFRHADIQVSILDLFQRSYCNHLPKLVNYRCRNQGVLYACIGFGQKALQGNDDSI
jgi:hypothetical protein